MAPSVTWYPVTDSSGSPVKGSAITVVDYGNVQAGYWSNAKAVVATFSGANSVSDLKFWLNDVQSSGGNSSVAAWTHTDMINAGWTNPANITNTQKGDVTGNSNDIFSQPAGGDSPGRRKFGVLPQTEPSSSNFVNSTLSSLPADTDYIYLAVQPPSNAGDGVTDSWGYRLSFLFS
jgi:hypothetical protein